LISTLIWTNLAFSFISSFLSLPARSTFHSSPVHRGTECVLHTPHLDITKLATTAQVGCVRSTASSTTNRINYIAFEAYRNSINQPEILDFGLYIRNPTFETRPTPTSSSSDNTKTRPTVNIRHPTPDKLSNNINTPCLPNHAP
jgi:hypothetical protein